MAPFDPKVVPQVATMHGILAARDLCLLPSMRDATWFFLRQLLRCTSRNYCDAKGVLQEGQGIAAVLWFSGPV